MKLNYWSSSKFANWLRGTPTPYKFPQMILSAVLSELAGTLSQHFLPPPCLPRNNGLVFLVQTG